MLRLVDFMPGEIRGKGIRKCWKNRVAIRKKGKAAGGQKARSDGRGHSVKYVGPKVRDETLHG